MNEQEKVDELKYLLLERDREIFDLKCEMKKIVDHPRVNNNYADTLFSVQSIALKCISK